MARVLELKCKMANDESWRRILSCNSDSEQASIKASIDLFMNIISINILNLIKVKKDNGLLRGVA